MLTNQQLDLGLVQSILVALILYRISFCDGFLFMCVRVCLCVIVCVFFVNVQTKFRLALACGNIDVAMQTADKLPDDAIWHQLGTEALRQGNHQARAVRGLLKNGFIQSFVVFPNGFYVVAISVCIFVVDTFGVTVGLLLFFTYIFCSVALFLFAVVFTLKPFLLWPTILCRYSTHAWLHTEAVAFLRDMQFPWPQATKKRTQHRTKKEKAGQKRRGVSLRSHKVPSKMKRPVSATVMRRKCSISHGQHKRGATLHKSNAYRLLRIMSIATWLTWYIHPPQNIPGISLNK